MTARGHIRNYTTLTDVINRTRRIFCPNTRSADHTLDGPCHGNRVYRTTPLEKPEDALLRLRRNLERDHAQRLPRLQ